MARFLGTIYGYKLDTKKRLSIPAKWRDSLGKEFTMVVTHIGEYKFITVYPVAVYDKMCESIESGDPLEAYENGDEFYANSFDSSMDGQGRVGVADYIIDNLGLELDCDLVYKGHNTFFEIWESSESARKDNLAKDSEGIYARLAKAEKNKKSINEA